MLALLTHEYFWLSFLPVSLLGVGFWTLLFDRADTTREPLWQLCLALGAGIISAMLVTSLPITPNLLTVPLVEELSKILFAIIFIEIFRCRFTNVSQGMMYGFVIGLGFALVENIHYLAAMHDATGFTADFWLVFQGRFWLSTLLHGSVTALFGTLYAGTYLFASTVKRRESPLWALIPNFTRTQLKEIFSLHVTVRHIFGRIKSKRGHFSRAVIWEGLWLCYLVHLAFNTLLTYQLTFVAFAFCVTWLIYLYRWNQGR
jgi:RsiW-degrading membrane proteinase PrsW (M82 family)